MTIKKVLRPSAAALGMSIAAVIAAAPAIGQTRQPSTAQTPGGEQAPSSAPGGPLAGGKLAMPSNSAERSKLLANLYAYLATAENSQQAQPIAQSIERLWLYTSSDTIALLMERAFRATTEKNLDLAIQLLDAVTSLAPDYAEGWNRRAYVHYLRNDVERMVGDLRRCLALEPNHYRALDGLAQVLRETGQKPAALKAYERLIEVHPNAPGAQDAIKELNRDVGGQRT
jgi:tetratricopeptide (TPR) repeat protein